MTLLPELMLKAGVLKGTKLVARPFASPAPSRTIVLATRRTSPRRRDADLLAEFILEQRRRSGRPGVPAHRRQPTKA